MPHRRLERLISKSSFPSYANPTHVVAAGASIVIVGLAFSALINRLAARKAERDNPPIGKFVEVGGLRLHYLEHCCTAMRV
jgi:hypothetical protein